MGVDPPHGMDPGGFPTQGISTDHNEAAPEVIVWDIGIYTAGDGNTGSVV